MAKQKRDYTYEMYKVWYAARQPEIVTWAKKQEQRNNKHNNRMLEFIPLKDARNCRLIMGILPSIEFEGKLASLIEKKYEGEKMSLFEMTFINQDAGSPCPEADAVIEYLYLNDLSLKELKKISIDMDSEEREIFEYGLSDMLLATTFSSGKNNVRNLEYMPFSRSNAVKDIKEEMLEELMKPMSMTDPPFDDQTYLMAANTASYTMGLPPSFWRHKRLTKDEACRALDGVVYEVADEWWKERGIGNYAKMKQEWEKIYSNVSNGSSVLVSPRDFQEPPQSSLEFFKNGYMEFIEFAKKEIPERCRKMYVALHLSKAAAAAHAEAVRLDKELTAAREELSLTSGRLEKEKARVQQEYATLSRNKDEQISSMQIELDKLRVENTDLWAELEGKEEELSFLRHMSEGDEERDVEDSRIGYANEPEHYEPGTILLGGHPIWQKKFRERHPEVKILDGTKDFPENAVSPRTPLVLLQWRHLSHKFFYKIMALKSRKGFPVKYLN